MSAGLKVLYRSTNFVDVLRDFRDLKPDHVVMTVAENHAQTDYTYAKLWSKATACAKKIAALTARGDRVLLPMSTSPEFVESFFGCVLSGRIPVPLPVEKADSQFSRIEGVLADCRPALAIFKSRTDLENIARKLNGIQAFAFADLPTPKETAEAVETPNPNQVMFIQYTSGSTARPKGVVLTHANVLANLRMIQQGMQTPESERSVSWLPLHHDMGLVGNVLLLVSMGAFTYVYPYQEFARNPLSWLEAISKQRGTVAGCPNFGYDAVLKRLDKSPGYDLSSIRLMYCGSERIAPRVISSFFESLAPNGLKPSTFFPCYGLAEASLYVSGAFEDPFKLSVLQSGKNAYPLCGFVAPGLMLRICDQAGRVLSPDEVGEIEISGASVSVGYWKEIEPLVHAGEFKGQGPSFLKTGDLGCLHQNQVVITGRAKDVIKIRGRNVYPEDLELLIERLTEWFGPNAVAVTRGAKVGEESEGITVFAEVLRNRRAGPFDSMLESIQQNLADADVRCERLIVLSPGSLPKTSSGKKQRSRTAKLFEEGSLKVLWDSAPEPSTETGERAVEERLEHLQAYVKSLNLVLSDERRSFPADFVNQLRRADVLGMLIPKEFGGAGLTHEQFAKIAVGIGQLDLTLASFVGIQNTIGTLPILHSSVYGERQSVLEDIARNGAITAFAITEPSAGSNPRAMEASARNQDGKLTLSGEKIWIGNAEFAQYICLFIKEVASDGKDLGVSAFLLRSDRHQFRVSEEQLTVGLRSMPQNRVLLDGCQLDERDRLTEAGDGLKLAFLAMEYARFGLAGMAVGGMRSVAQKSFAYAQSREIWTGSLADNAYFQETMGDINLRADCLEALVSSCAERLNKSGNLPAVASLSAKILCGEWGFAACDQALQFTGGRGYTETFGLGRVWRDARILRIFEGPTETMAYQLGGMILREFDQMSEITGQALAQTFSEFKSLVDNARSQVGGTLAHESLTVHVGQCAAKLIAMSAYVRRNAKMAGSLERLAMLEIKDLEQRIARATWFRAHRDALTVVPHPLTRVPSRVMYDSWAGEASVANHSLPISAVPQTAPAVLQADKATVPTTSAAVKTHASDEIRADLHRWLTTFTRVKQISDDVSLASYGVDSLLAYELLCFVEEQYGVTLPETIITKKPSINDILTTIQNTTPRRIPA